MSQFRGFSTYLISRVSRAQGASNYLDDDTLRFFDAYGGAMANIDDNTVAVVESVRQSPFYNYRTGEYCVYDREYRVTVFRFTPAPHGEYVEVERVTENDTRSRTQRLFREYVRDARATVTA